MQVNNHKLNVQAFMGGATGQGQGPGAALDPWSLKCFTVLPEGGRKMHRSHDDVVVVCFRWSLMF